MDNPMAPIELFRLGPVIINQVVVVTWVVMGAIVLFALWVRLHLRRDKPGRAQQVAEGLLDWLRQEVRAIVDRPPEPFVPLVGSLFLFIFVSNLSSQVSPFAGPNVMPPTADINTTAALATVVFLAVPVYGVLLTGTLNYLKTYLQPVWIMLPFNVMSEVSRTVALAVRLFGNILSAEILIGVLLAIVPFFLPVPLMFLGLITGTIQAYIFAALSIVYIGGAIKMVEQRGQKKEESA